jgi:threonine dehydrogenase-like Zn-dependent dehydrogenase
MPIVFGRRGPELIGYSNRYPGGFGEYMVLQEMFLAPVPADLPSEQAALVEPLAVGEHAVARAAPRPDDVCVVVGCGPIGVAVIAALKARGCGPVVAADFSRMRRGVAEAVGADVVVDPAQESPFSRWDDFGVPRQSIERIAAETLGTPLRDAIVFEAVGVPGVLQSIIDGAPAAGRIVVVGLCMESDRIEPAIALNKELDIRFAYGYRPADFEHCLRRLGEGTVDGASLISDRVPLDGVAEAFAVLRDPEQHAKVVVSHEA